MKNVHKNQDDMIAIIYKALGEGLSKLIRNGTGLSILTAVCGGLVYGMIMLHTYHQRLHDELKQEIKVIKEEKEKETISHHIDLANCQNENKILAIKVAELTVIVNRLQVRGRN